MYPFLCVTPCKHATNDDLVFVVNIWFPFFFRDHKVRYDKHKVSTWINRINSPQETHLIVCKITDFLGVGRILIMSCLFGRSIPFVCLHTQGKRLVLWGGGGGGLTTMAIGDGAEGWTPWVGLNICGVCVGGGRRTHGTKALLLFQIDLTRYGMSFLPRCRRSFQERPCPRTA